MMLLTIEDRRKTTRLQSLLPHNSAHSSKSERNKASLPCLTFLSRQMWAAFSKTHNGEWRHCITPSILIGLKNQKILYVGGFDRTSSRFCRSTTTTSPLLLLVYLMMMVMMIYINIIMMLVFFYLGKKYPHLFWVFDVCPAKGTHYHCVCSMSWSWIRSYLRLCIGKKDHLR